MFTEWVVVCEYTDESIYYDEPDSITIVESSQWVREGKEYTMKEAITKYEREDSTCKVLKVYRRIV